MRYWRHYQVDGAGRGRRGLENIPQKGMGLHSPGSPFSEGARGWERQEPSVAPGGCGSSRNGPGVS